MSAQRIDERRWDFVDPAGRLGGWVALPGALHVDALVFPVIVGRSVDDDGRTIVRRFRIALVGEAGR